MKKQKKKSNLRIYSSNKYLKDEKHWMCSNLITLTCMGIGWVSWYNCNWHSLANSSFLLMMIKPLFCPFTSSSSSYSSSKRDFFTKIHAIQSIRKFLHLKWILTGVCVCVCYTHTFSPRYYAVQARDSMIKNKKDRAKKRKCL